MSKWLMRGDRNSSFYHLLQKTRRVTEGIRALWNDGINDDRGAIERHILEFYYESFRSQGMSADLSEVDSVISSLLTSRGNFGLLQVSLAPKIKDVVFVMDPHSSPGPDGFTGLFFKACWGFVTPVVIRDVQHTFVTCSFPVGLNSNFMALLPKLPSAERIVQFCSIMLGNFIFEVVTNIVASRLAPIAARIVSHN